MKITCVQSLAPGAQQSSAPTADIFVNLDDNDDSTGTNESGVVFLDSVESSIHDEQDTPLSPDQVGDSSKLSCAIDKDGTESSSPVVVPLESSSPDVQSPQSSDFVEILDPPASPLPSEAVSSGNNAMKIRFELPDVAILPFALDNEGDNSSNNESKTADNSENSSQESAAMGIFGQGMCDDWNRRRAEVKPVYFVDTNHVLDNQQASASTNSTKNTVESQESQFPSVAKRTCFNCMGEHTLNRCPHPHDAGLIAARRREYFNNRGVIEKDVRYHKCHQVSTSGYGNYKPGVISSSLRSALGLASNEVPGYIYKMREAGYPPGWFRQAVDNACSLKVYGSDIESDSKSSAATRDRLKKGLVEYPGFTSPMPAGYRDDGARLGVPFNEKYTVENMANQWYQQQSRNEKREFLTAKRTSGLNKPGESTASSVSGYRVPRFPPRRSNWQDDSAYPKRHENQNERHRMHTNKNVSKQGNWYDDLLPSTPSTRHITADMQTMENIYQKVIEKKSDNTVLGWTELQYKGLNRGGGNYRESEEIERREEEERKLLAKKKKTEMDLEQQRKRQSDDRCKSPSLLDDNIPMEFTTTYPSDIVNESSTVSVETVKETNQKPGKSGTRPQKRPLESDAEIITIDSDDDGEVEGEKVEMLPNPLFKKPRLTDVTEEVSTPTIADSPMKLNTDCKTPNERSETLSRSEKQQLNDDGNGESRVTPLEPYPSVSLPSTAQKVAQSSYSKEEELDRNDLLNILAKNFEEKDALTFADLPPISNFSKGMPELPLQEEATEFSGRLAKVLSIIHKKKEREMKDEDDDVQIID